jgi:hypothetical protein
MSAKYAEGNLQKIELISTKQYANKNQLNKKQATNL